MARHDRSRTSLPIAAIVLAWLALQAFAAEGFDQLPDPDGILADMPKPVQVYVLLWQSNMVRTGKVSHLSQ